jgi:16S rRNA (adenine1518-N6/adenine1519-N6)-dimethyltransferase
MYVQKRSLGQNFLIDKNIIKKIIKIGNINSNSKILEIGPGSGNLTNEIINKKPKKIIAIEKDKNLCLLLKKKFEKNKNIKIINEDILKTINKNNFEKKTIVFGNLPYNISTKILTSFLLLKKWPPWFDVLILMFQKEVAERIIAKSRTKEFGRLSVLSNWRMDVKKHFEISNNCFFPRPKINSTVLSFTPKNNFQFLLKNPKTLEHVTRILFSSRRKMINKSLNKLFNKRINNLNTLNINYKLRAEDLDNKTFYQIADIYENLFY